MSNSTVQQSAERRTPIWTKATSIVLLSALTSASLSASAAELPAPNELQEQAASPIIRFEGKPISLPLTPEVQQDVLMLPARAVLEWLGYEVTWNQQNYSVTAVHSNGSRLVFAIGRAETEIEGLIYSNPDSPTPYLKEDFSFIPIDFVAGLQDVELSQDPLTGHLALCTLDTEEATKIRVATRTLNASVPVPEKVTQYMSEVWGIEPNIHQIPTEHYRERINLLIAAGDLHDLMLLDNPYNYGEDLITTVFLDLTEYLPDYPQLAALVGQDAASPGLNYGDGIYGIPLPKDVHESPFPAIRKDWFDMLGFDIPRTMEQLYEALLSIQESDPEGDGKNNTIGISGYSLGNSLGTLSWVEQIFTGSESRFYVQENELIDTVVTEEQTQALQWLTDAYREGILDPEFAVMNQDQAAERNASGHVILTAMTPIEAARTTLSLQEEGRTDMWIPLPGLQAESDSPVIVPINTQSPMVYAVPNHLPEGKVRAVLEWLEKGIGKSVEQWEAEGLSGQELEFVLQWFGRENLLSEPIFSSGELHESVGTLFENAVTEWKNVEVQTQGFPQADRLFNRGEYAQLNERIQRKKIEVIMGKLPLEEWQQFVVELQDNPEYQEMMSQLTALYSGT